MNLSVGIVGLPNAGKSTLFNALLKKQVAFAANYPFATIEPNVGIVPVPDGRLSVLASIVEKEDGIKPPLVPATVEFVDIAGLVAGASGGQGLGNKFLAHIREVHLIVNVLRFFKDESVVHVAGDVDPKRDRDIVETELVLADLQTIIKQIEPRGVKDAEVQKRWDCIIRLKAGLDKGTPARLIITDPEEQLLVKDLQLLTMKPILYVANVAENELAGFSSPYSDLSPLVAISAKVEQDLAGLTDEEQTVYMNDLGVKDSGLDRLIRAAYEMLGLMSFLTSGVKEVRAWTIQAGTKAPQAAGVIHTDFEKKFIKADVVSFNDFVESGGWVQSREKGKVRMEGREYIMRDGDIVEFKIGS